MENEEFRQLFSSIKCELDLPDPPIDCQFLPCGKTLKDFALESWSFPKLDAERTQTFNGLHMLLGTDLVINKTVQPTEGGIHSEDAALLADIEGLNIAKPTAVHSFPARGQKGRELFDRERRSVLQRMQPESTQLDMEALSLEQQKQIISQTFVDIKKPIGPHPTKINSNARPVSVLPIFPDGSREEFAHLQFDIPPGDSSCNLLKDCGNYMINFKLIEQSPKMDVQFYNSDQRFKEDRTLENCERGEPMILRKNGERLFYQTVNKHIKLRKERPTPHSSNSHYLLQVLWDKEKVE